MAIPNWMVGVACKQNETKRMAATTVESTPPKPNGREFEESKNWWYTIEECAERTGERASEWAAHWWAAAAAATLEERCKDERRKGTRRERECEHWMQVIHDHSRLRRLASQWFFFLSNASPAFSGAVYMRCRSLTTLLCSLFLSRWFSPLSRAAHIRMWRNTGTRENTNSCCSRSHYNFMCAHIHELFY